MTFVAIYKRKKKTLDKKFNSVSLYYFLSHLNHISADYAPFHFFKQITRKESGTIITIFFKKIQLEDFHSRISLEFSLHPYGRERERQSESSVSLLKISFPHTEVKNSCTYSFILLVIRPFSGNQFTAHCIDDNFLLVWKPTQNIIKEQMQMTS